MSSTLLDKLRKISAAFTGLALVYDSTPPTPADGDVAPAQMGSKGGLLVEYPPGYAPPASGVASAVDQGGAGVAGWLVKVVNAANALIGVEGSPLAVRLSDGATFVGAALDATVEAVRDRLPASIGQLAQAASLSVALSTEDAAKVPGLGQTLAAGCVPVVLPVAQAGGALALESSIQALLTALAPVSVGVNDVQSATGSATALGDHVAVQGVIVVADDANTVPVYVGFASVTTSNGIALNAGESKFYRVTNSSLIHIITASGSPAVRYEVT